MNKAKYCAKLVSGATLHVVYANNTADKRPASVLVFEVELEARQGSV